MKKWHSNRKKEGKTFICGAKVTEDTESYSYKNFKIHIDNRDMERLCYDCATLQLIENKENYI